MGANTEIADRFEAKIEDKLNYVDQKIDGEIDYSEEPGSIDFEISISDEDTGLEAQITYSSEYNREFAPEVDTGEIGLEIYDNGDVVYEASREVALKGSDLDEYILITDDEKDNISYISSKLVEGLEEVTEHSSKLISEDSIIRFEQLLDNSTSINNSAAQDLIDHQRNRINSNNSADRPLYWLGGPISSEKYPEIRDADEAREKVRNSPEAEKWRELGEELASGEKDMEVVQKMIDNLEDNPDKRITDFAV